MSDNHDLKICHNCVGEAFLSNLIEKGSMVGTCQYCGDEDEPCITLKNLAEQIESAFERHYVRTSDQPDEYEYMLQREEEDYYWERNGEPVLEVIQDMAKISGNVAQDVLDILGHRNFDLEMMEMGAEWEFHEDSHYEWKGTADQEFAFEWQAIERSLKSETRFFNQNAEAFLARLFANLEDAVTRDGQPVVLVAGPDTACQSFFRARVFHNGDELGEAMKRPDLHLGPPPGRLARAGRMNANGISMFYGASDRDVALSEVRPPVGSRALIGEFRLIRQVRLLDVTALQSVYVEGSIFDPTYQNQMSLAKFLARLSDRITIPVMPGDEPSEYLITQMIADYLARHPAPALDGILFRSVQSPGEHRNVALFHHASRIEPIALPDGTELSAHQYEPTEEDDEDGVGPDYVVWEQVPPPTEAGGGEADDHRWMLGMFEATRYDPSEDFREVTLQLDVEAITAHHIRGVTFTTHSFPVRRHRMEKRDPQF